MPQTRKKPAKKPAITADQDTINQALADLGIDRPYTTVRVVGNRLELALYGGDIVTWPPQRTRKRTAKEE